MIEYYCGRPKCGKSYIAEKALSAVPGPVAYVGTLPNIRLYWETIRVHRQRRPSGWALYECSGDLKEDLDALIQMLGSYRGILLDGGTFYLNHLLEWGYSPSLSDLRTFMRAIKAASLSDVKLIVVDQPLAGMPEDIRRLGGVFHKALCRYSGSMFYVREGRQSPATAAELERYDGVCEWRKADANTCN